jgi:hypothetical protein
MLISVFEIEYDIPIPRHRIFDIHGEERAVLWVNHLVEFAIQEANCTKAADVRKFMLKITRSEILIMPHFALVEVDGVQIFKHPLFMGVSCLDNYTIETLCRTFAQSLVDVLPAQTRKRRRSRQIASEATAI